MQYGKLTKVMVVARCWCLGQREFLLLLPSCCLASSFACISTLYPLCVLLRLHVLIFVARNNVRLFFQFVFVLSHGCSFCFVSVSVVVAHIVRVSLLVNGWFCLCVLLCGQFTCLVEFFLIFICYRAFAVVICLVISKNQ